MRNTRHSQAHPADKHAAYADRHAFLNPKPARGSQLGQALVMKASWTGLGGLHDKILDAAMRRAGRI